MRLAIALLLAFVCNKAVAYPSGAGSCAAGVAAVQGPHLTRGTITTGSLALGGFTVALGGSPLVDGVTSTFDINTDVSLTIAGTKTFKGFLLRLGGSNTISSLTGTGDVQVSNICTVDGVGGVTHTSASEKTTVTATLRLATAAAGLPLDVLVVVQNSGVTNISEYYHTSFLLTARDSLPVPSTPVTPGPAVIVIPAPVSQTPTRPVPLTRPIPLTSAPILPPADRKSVV